MKTERILVVYYSRTGNTERVARDVAARLGADLEKIVDHASRLGFIGYLRAVYDSTRKIAADIAAPQKNPADYELTIVGTPVWGWNITPAARAFLQKAKGTPRELAFFVTSGNTDAQRIVPGMEEVAERKALAFTGFNSDELKNPAAYEKKLAAFIAGVGTRTRGDEKPRDQLFGPNVDLKQRRFV
jgi:menaquinone-dependent protoporphyrinogen IX oxidase